MFIEAEKARVEEESNINHEIYDKK